MLTAGGSLESAYAAIQPAEQEFSASLLRARAEIQAALGRLRGFDGQQESLIGIAEDILESVTAVLNHMKNKKQQAEEGDK